MSWNSGSIVSVTPWADLSTKLKNLCGGAGVENWSFLENIPAGTGTQQSGSASYSLDLFKCKGSNARYMPITVTNKLNANITADGASFNFNAGVLRGGRVYILSIINTKASAADQPVSVAFTGTNVPVFSLLKTQAGGNVGEIRVSVYIARTIGSQAALLPSAIDTSVGLPPYDDDEFYTVPMNLVATFGAASQTGCMAIMDEWDGLDGSLAVDTIGNTSIAVQAVGANGTTETAHSATLAPFLGSTSVAYTVAAETASTGTYSVAEWMATAADLSMATPTAHARAMWNPNTVDTTGVLTLSSATSETSWAAISIELQRPQTTQDQTATLNDAGANWYFAIEIPVSDGAVVSSINASEAYEIGPKIFAGMAALPAATSPAGANYWIGSGYNQYASVTGNNRANTLMGTLNTSGFSYWIKLTKNSVLISTRVSGTESSAFAGLLDSFVANVADRCPLVLFVADTASETASSSFTSLPGVSSLSGGVASRGWQATFTAWTHNVLSTAPEGGSLFNNAAATNVDLWQNGKTYVARIVCFHAYGTTSGTVSSTSGYYRGLVKSDFLCIASGGTVQLGDTMVISGITWTVIKTMGTIGSSGQSIAWLTREI